MIVFEKPTLTGVMTAMPYLLYIGIMSSGIAYTLQIVGQQLSENPTVASIIMSLESVFAALGGLLVGETLSVKEGIGCIIMFAAIILSQVDFKRKEVSL
jgi:drug/metabolite transporter (DMT)-like permease